MAIIPVGFIRLKEFDSWELSVRFADNVNLSLKFEIEYDNDFTRSNYGEYFEEDD